TAPAPISTPRLLISIMTFSLMLPFLAMALALKMRDKIAPTTRQDQAATYEEPGNFFGIEATKSL
ncbi:MAG TPA: hypothetical protein VE986_05980, partial [Hyphomicrobiales bacterium]|nr:hypothetical protein [Hyphomicrobiales bacterium]